MEWSLDKISNYIKVYNNRFFNKAIKKPIVVNWDRNLYKTGIKAQTSDYNDYHEITFNITLANTSREVMRNIIAHEMIHCLQDEVDDTWEATYKDDEGHNQFFLKWCAKLNAEHKFRFPIERFISYRSAKSQSKTNTGLYYIYQILEYQDGSKEACGVFVKFLYENEVNIIRDNGLSIQYFNNIKFNNTVHYVALKNKSLITADSYNDSYNDIIKQEEEWVVDFDEIKDISIGANKLDFEDALKEAGLKGKTFYSGEFNFESGRNVVSSTDTVNEALGLLILNDYIIE